MNDLIKIFKALSDGNRLKIVKMLTVKELCVCEIKDVLNLATSTVSKHLTILKDAGIISDRKDSRWVNYRINLHSDIDIKNIIEIISRRFDQDKKVTLDLEKVKQSNRIEICNVK